MSLAEKVKQQLAPVGLTNRIDRWLATLPDEEREAALILLTTPCVTMYGQRVSGWTQTEILDHFHDEGFGTSRESLRRWFRANGIDR